MTVDTMIAIQEVAAIAIQEEAEEDSAMRQRTTIDAGLRRAMTRATVPVVPTVAEAVRGRLRAVVVTMNMTTILLVEVVVDAMHRHLRTGVVVRHAGELVRHVAELVRHAGEIAHHEGVVARRTDEVPVQHGVGTALSSVGEDQALHETGELVRRGVGIVHHRNGIIVGAIVIADIVVPTKEIACSLFHGKVSYKRKTYCLWSSSESSKSS